MRWQDTFTRIPGFAGPDPMEPTGPVQLSSLAEVKAYLDWIHIKHCLVRPYFLSKKYPLVEARELLPSFDSDTMEYKQLPGFSMVVLARPLNYFQEVFQFDVLHSLLDQDETTLGMFCPLERTVIPRNLQTVLNRLPRHSQDGFRTEFGRMDVTDMEHYPRLLPYLLQMERAHVMSLDAFGSYHLSGVYGSLPSDLDTELKRFGLRIGKFKVGDNARYERNRPFVYQFLMELYGFPVVSERRTSAALFARRLHKMGEQFLIRVLGQSDRTLTTLHSAPGARAYPRVEKTALVRVDRNQKDALKLLKDGGWLLDPGRRVVILRVAYTQHKYHEGNIRQERALSVLSQEVVHPLTGEPLDAMNIIKDTTNMLLRLNDIVQGEYAGRILYKRNELVVNTDSEEKRLKFLYAWLTKNQRRIIGYSDEFYAGVSQVLDRYLLNPDKLESFKEMKGLFDEVWGRYSYIMQARKVKQLEDLKERQGKAGRISHGEMLVGAVELLHNLQFEVVTYFDEIVSSVIHTTKSMLADSYIRRQYADRKDEELTDYGREIKKHYAKLVSLLDAFTSIRRSRAAKQDGALARTG